MREHILMSAVCGLLALGALGVATARMVLRPREFRLTSTINQFDRVAWQAVPIILLITFLIGAIISQQGIFHFRKFGAELYSVDLVGILVLREIGVLIVAIMVAGRSGSSYTAELGSMKMREEIDAMRTLGIDPMDTLVLPRVLALIVAPQETARLFGWNLAIIFAVVYLAQGASIVEYYLLKAHIKSFGRGVIMAFILAMPSIVFVIALGIVDVWADVRKVRGPAK